jgi:type II secretory ATPase GspE/PulE/Tfp pilus assembly ATPase PilB-like protein
MTVRFRADGCCYDYLKVPGSSRRAFASRLKIMARLDIAERRKPQDGKIKVRVRLLRRANDPRQFGGVL